MVITTAQADVNGDGVLDTVSLTGERDAEGSAFIRDITLVITDGKSGRTATTALRDNAGYNPRLFIGDFTCDGVPEILISIDSGGSGGFGYYYIFSYKGGVVNQLLDAEKFNATFKYTVTFREGCRVAVTSDYFRRTYFIDVSDRLTFYREQGVYDRSCRLQKPTSGWVPGLNNLFPEAGSTPNCYNLLAFQRVVGLFNADTIGILQTTLAWDKTEFVGVSEYVRQ